MGVINKEYDIEKYLSELKNDLISGFIEESDYEESMVLFKQYSNKKSEDQIKIEDVDQDNIMIKRLENIFYRRVFGTTKPKQSQNFDDICEEVEFIPDVLMATVNDNEAGALWYCICPEIAYNEKFQNKAYIEKLIVADHQKGKNIGTNLIFELLTRTDDDIVKSIVVDSWLNSREFYRKNGFLYSNNEIMNLNDAEFQRMELPMNYSDFSELVRKDQTLQELIEGYNLDSEVSENFGTGNFEPIEYFDTDNLVEEYIKLISKTDMKLCSNPESNPFLVPIYQKLKKKHKLLSC